METYSFRKAYLQPELVVSMENNYVITVSSMMLVDRNIKAPFVKNSVVKYVQRTSQDD